MRKDQPHGITLHLDDTRDLFADRRDIRMYHQIAGADIAIRAEAASGEMWFTAGSRE